jgi:hypothetical protein
LTGSVFGGQQPIAGAHVYLFAANSTGYGQASVSLLDSAKTGNVDSVGAYVLTDAGGGFSITGDYTCVAGSQVYLYALGGNSGSGVNSAAGLMAALGNCPSVGNFSSSLFIMVNEVSTVTAAYAMAGFATDARHVSSSGTALAQTGIANAFANAANLADISTGAALASTPAGNGTVSQSEINTLANVLAACVNSTGAVTGPTNATPCYTLFTSALSGGTTGTQPTDTATAAINMAHNPGANVASLFGLASGTPPFAPNLVAQPNDFTVVLNFTGGGLYYPHAIVIDGAGNAWVANYDKLSKFSSSGVAISPTGGYTGGGMGLPNKIAVDPSGNAWVTNPGSNCISEFSNTGVAISPAGGYTGGGLNSPTEIAIDGSGNAWATNYSGKSLTELSNSGTALSPGTGYTGGGLDVSFGIAIDGTGNVWATGSSNIAEFSNSGIAISPAGGYISSGVNFRGGTAIDSFGNVWVASTSPIYCVLYCVSKFSSTGAMTSGSPFSSASLNQPQSVAVDGSGNVWISNSGSGTSISVTEFSNSGAAISPAAGYIYIGGGLAGAQGLAIDGSGNVWIASGSGGNIVTITEFIGAATPVVTPLAVGVKNNSLGTRP